MRYRPDCLGAWARRLSPVQTSLLCTALDRFSGAGPAATTQQLPFFTHVAARESLTKALPHLTERGQQIVRDMLAQITSMEEVDGKNSGH